MKIAVVGLGLIGGSLCKTIRRRTGYTCLGLDRDADTLRAACEQEAIDGVICPEELGQADLVILCLYPQAAIDFALENRAFFKKGSLVLDVCGVKAPVVRALTEPLREQGVTFIGAHPMAGREFSGFAYAQDNLFEKASFILTPLADTPGTALERAKSFAQALGFARIVVTTPEEHDRIIAYTSQLAHIVSSAYIKSPSLDRESGFSAGSFLDMTRVARLNEEMWTALFRMNREPLLFEVDQMIRHLAEYRDALAADDAGALEGLLRDGRERKERSAI